MAKKPRTGHGLRGVSFEALEREIADRRRRLAGLQRRYQRAAKKTESLARQIEALGGRVSAREANGKRRRPQNKQSLIDCLRAVLSGKALGISATLDAIQASGYRSSSGDFRSLVTKAIIRSGEFKRVGRGMYRAK